MGTYSDGAHTAAYRLHRCNSAELDDTSHSPSVCMGGEYNYLSDREPLQYVPYLGQCIPNMVIRPPEVGVSESLNKCCSTF